MPLAHCGRAAGHLHSPDDRFGSCAGRGVVHKDALGPAGLLPHGVPPALQRLPVRHPSCRPCRHNNLHSAARMQPFNAFIPGATGTIARPEHHALRVAVVTFSRGSHPYTWRCSACRAYLRLVLLAEGAGVVAILQPHAQAAPCADCFVVAAAYSHNLHALLKLRLTLVVRSRE